MTATDVTPEVCTTTFASSRHLSLNLEAVTDSPYITGRVGRTLCGHRAYDELAATENLGRPVNLADLKPCKSCDRSAAARKETNRG